MAYHSRGSSWKVSSKESIASDFATLLRIKQGETLTKNDAIRNQISDFDNSHVLPCTAMFCLVSPCIAMYYHVLLCIAM